MDPASDKVAAPPANNDQPDTAATVLPTSGTAAPAPDPTPTAVAPSAAPARTSNADSGASSGRAPGPSLDVDTKRPEDFKGEVRTTNELPSPELLKKVENYMLLDKDGKTHTFKSLYTGPNVPRRLLVIFVRHFFCGNCQEYLRSLSESITTDALLSLPVSTFITVIGCGDPRLIDMYARETSCPFPIYTDPKGHLFAALGMVKTLNPGEKPAYMKRGMLGGALASIGQGLRQISAGLALKAGDQRQVGGEFLFEPYDISSPITTPSDEEKHKKINGGMEQGLIDGEAKTSHDVDAGRMEEKKVSWCNRMKSTRDHAEIPELMEVLGLQGHGKPIEDQELWRKALSQRKGTGSSLAPEMGQLSDAQK